MRAFDLGVVDGYPAVYNWFNNTSRSVRQAISRAIGDIDDSDTEEIPAWVLNERTLRNEEREIKEKKKRKIEELEKIEDSYKQQKKKKRKPALGQQNRPLLLVASAPPAGEKTPPSSREKKKSRKGKSRQEKTKKKQRKTKLTPPISQLDSDGASTEDDEKRVEVPAFKQGEKVVVTEGQTEQPWESCATAVVVDPQSMMVSDEGKNIPNSHGYVEIKDLRVRSRWSTLRFSADTIFAKNKQGQPVQITQPTHRSFFSFMLLFFHVQYSYLFLQVSQIARRYPKFSLLHLFPAFATQKFFNAYEKKKREKGRQQS
jgi:hypothetical protein